MKIKKGFTLPEILITIVVIGIIAAITINIINTNVRKAEVEAKLKKTVSILNSAIFKATIDYGPADQWPELKTNSNYEVITKKYIAPYISTLKPIQTVSLEKLGYKERIKTPKGGNYTVAGGNYTTTEYPRIILNDGTILLRVYTVYNQFAYLIDVNGIKGPNVAGRDVFQVGIDKNARIPFARMLAPKMSQYNSTTGETTYIDNTNPIALENIKNKGCANSGQYCGYLIERNGYKIPKDYPLRI